LFLLLIIALDNNGLTTAKQSANAASALQYIIIVRVTNIDGLKKSVLSHSQE